MKPTIDMKKIMDQSRHYASKVAHGATSMWLEDVTQEVALAAWMAAERGKRLNMQWKAMDAMRSILRSQSKDYYLKRDDYAYLNDRSAHQPSPEFHLAILRLDESHPASGETAAAMAAAGMLRAAEAAEWCGITPQAVSFGMRTLRHRANSFRPFRFSSKRPKVHSE